MTTIDINYIDDIIQKYTTEQFCGMQEQIDYALSSGGKRIRPFLLLSMAQALNVLDDNTQRMAVALECVHTYSLVHDDLPAMDDDDFRRGKPTLHKKYDEATAVLAGDCLLNMSMEILTRTEKCTEGYFKAINYLYKCSGGQGMIWGQVLDIGKINNTIKDIVLCATNKTGRLLQASIVMPLMYAERYNAVDLAEELGELLGQAYQLADDILDGNKHDETSYLSVMNIGQAQAYLRELTYTLNQKCNALQQVLGCKLQFLSQIIEFNANRHS